MMGMSRSRLESDTSDDVALHEKRERRLEGGQGKRGRKGSRDREGGGGE
jgi:hypothetical protein